MRRKPGAILPLELSIPDAGVSLRQHGAAEFHGFLIAKEVSEREGACLLTAYGTLHKALSRMEKAGLLSSRWEDPLIAAQESRPRRRLYEVSPASARALSEARRSERQKVAKPGLRAATP